MIELNANLYAIETMPRDKVLYYSYSGEEEIKRGDLVLINTELGEEVGTIMMGPKEMTFEEIGYEPQFIIRKLTSEDEEIHNSCLEDAKEATNFTKLKAREFNLNMRVLRAKYTFDKSKLIIFFGADSRIDFRELVKELAKKYKVRIELRQVGIRDEVKMRCSLGFCGQISCCSRFLREFDSIKMELAKTQQMMINTAKISGRCGKLLCCLKYENQFYEEIMQGIPYEGTTIEHEGKPARVVTVNVFLKEVTLQIIEDNQPILLKIPFDFFKANSFITYEETKDTKPYVKAIETNEEIKNIED